MGLNWFGYRHVNGSLHLKRYLSFDSYQEAKESDFVAEITEVFRADSRQEAAKHFREILNDNEALNIYALWEVRFAGEYKEHVNEGVVFASFYTFTKDKNIKPDHNECVKIVYKMFEQTNKEKNRNDKPVKVNEAKYVGDLISIGCHLD